MPPPVLTPSRCGDMLLISLISLVMWTVAHESTHHSLLDVEFPVVDIKQDIPAHSNQNSVLFLFQLWCVRKTRNSLSYSSRKSPLGYHRIYKRWKSGVVSVVLADALLASLFFHLQSTSLWDVPGYPAFLQYPQNLRGLPSVAKAVDGSILVVGSFI